MSCCEWWWVLKFCCSLRVVDEISKADWMELKGIFLRVRFVILEMELELYVLVQYSTITDNYVSVRIGVTINTYDNPRTYFTPTN